MPVLDSYCFCYAFPADMSLTHQWHWSTADTGTQASSGGCLGRSALGVAQAVHSKSLPFQPDWLPSDPVTSFLISIRIHFFLWMFFLCPGRAVHVHWQQGRSSLLWNTETCPWPSGPYRQCTFCFIKAGNGFWHFFFLLRNPPSSITCVPGRGGRQFYLP